MEAEVNAAHLVAPPKQKIENLTVIQGLGEKEVQGMDQVFTQIAPVHNGIDHAMFQ
jgi:hypothetical protein